MRDFRSPILAACCLLLLLTADAVCGVSDAAVLFLRIAPAARSAGMGEAFVAVSDDASATHWNPAGLGEYPLADSWYQFPLSDDSRLKSLARKALEKSLRPDFEENIMSWQIVGNEVHRSVNGEWQAAETITLDPNLTFVTSLSRLARTDDKEMFKVATREICRFNTGVSFDDINDIRLSLLEMVSKDAAAGDRVNQMMEKMLVAWQDLRLHADAFEQFRSGAEQLEADQTISAEELNEIESYASACELDARPTEVKIPYSVLLTVWRSWEVPWEENIDKIAVLENSVPTDNYARYDIWAVTNFGLKQFDGVNWRSSMTSETALSLIPKPGDRITDVIGRVLSTADDELVASRLETVARVNNVISREELGELRAELEAAVPQDYLNYAEFSEKLQALDDTWLNCLLDRRRVVELQNYFKSAYSDSILTQTETDRAYFTLDKAIRTELPQYLELPFSAVFDGEVTDLAVQGKTLYVATTKGMFQFNGNAWQRFSTGLPGEAVYCIEVVKRNNIWIGTDSGVEHYEQSQWKTYGVADGVIDLPIKVIHVKNEQSVWVASDEDLYYFDGSKWSNSFRYVTTVTDSARSVLTNAYGDLDEIMFDFELAQFQFRYPEFIENPTAGVEVDLPFKPLFEGNITCLTADNDNNLWVGTELGIKRFDGTVWRSYGYKAIRVERPMTLETFAAEYLKTNDPDRIAGFVSIIKRKNTIQKGNLPEGRILYVYANPAGSPINDLYNHGGRVYVASFYGTFSYKDGVWERYYHEDLHRLNTKTIVGKGGEIWFATSDRVVVYAHARKEFSFTHSKWLPELASDLYYEFFTYVQPVGGLGTIGANITFLSFGEIARTSENDPQILETFSSFDGAFTLSYGIRASKNAAIGLSAKIIYSKLADQGAGSEIGQGSGTSFAVDAGLIYHFNKKFTLGAALTNLGPDMSYIDAAQSDPLPRNVALGLSYRLLDSPYNRLTVVGEVNKLIATLTDDFSTEIREAIFNFGAEYWYGSLLALRAGYYIDNEGESTYPTVGLGLQLKEKYRIDFAYIPTSDQHVLGNTLRTSLTVRL